MSATFKILQVIDTMQPGGAEKVVVTISNLLHQNGQHVTVLTVLSEGPLKNQLHENISTKCLCRKNKWDPFTMWKLASICRKFDIIHVHSSFNLRYVALALKLFRVKKKIFFQEHDGRIDRDTKVKWHQKLLYPKTIFITVSSKMFTWSVYTLKMPGDRVHLLPNTVLQTDVKNNYQKKDTSITQLLVVSNILEIKNISFAIEVLKELSTVRSCQLTIVGHKFDNAYHKRLQEIIITNGLINHVSFLHDVSDVQKILPSYDLALHTSKSESGPIVLIEYLAAGLPFLAFDTGEVALHVKERLSECIIDNFEIKKWIDKIDILLSQDQQKLSEKLHLIYTSFYSPGIYYKKLINIYSSQHPEIIA